MVWEYEGTHPKSVYGEITRKHLGESAGEAVDRFVGAYNELATQKFESPSKLKDHFLMSGVPMFSDDQAKNVYNKVLKKGGSTESAVSDGVNAIVDLVSGKSAMGPPNPAVKAAIESIQQVIRMVLPFVFILNTIEQSPAFGDLIGAALDVTAATLPVIASTIQTTTPALVGLIPLPLAGPVGIALGWLFSLFFLWLAMVIGVSRKDFSSALEATAGMIPVVGGTAMRTVGATDRVLTKLTNRAEKIQAAISEAYGSLKGALETVVKNPNFQNTSNFLQNMPITKMAQNTVANSPAIQTAKSIANTPGVRVAKDIAMSPTTRSLTNIGSNIASSPSYQKFRRTVGGKRFTRRKKNKYNKCRRTRCRSRKH